MMLAYQNESVPKTEYMKIKIMSATSLKYLYVPYNIYKNIFSDQEKVKIGLEFDFEISIRSFISYICDIVDMKKQLNIIVGDTECIEKYIISKHSELKKYPKYCFPSGLSVKNFKIFKDIVLKYGMFGDDLFDSYCKSEISINLYNIDATCGKIPNKYFSNRGLYIVRGQKYNIASLSKYKFVCYKGYNCGNIFYFDIKIIDGLIYLKGPFEMNQSLLLSHKSTWDSIFTKNVYIEQQNIFYGKIYIEECGNKILWTSTYQYIMLMQNEKKFRDSSIKLKIQDDVSDDTILYISLYTLLSIDEVYFGYATDIKFIEQFGDSDPSIYFSGNQTAKGFYFFLEHYLDSIDKHSSPAICFKSDSDIDMYTYYQRFNLHSKLNLSLGVPKQTFANMLDKYEFDKNEINLYELLD